MSFRYSAGFNKPGFNPLATQTSTILYNLYGWGVGTGGALGLGNTTTYSSPMQVGSLTVWSSVNISSGSNFSAAIKSDGTLWMWGNNPYGQLGLGNTTNYSSPKQVGALTNWSQIASSGPYSSVAIKTDGTLWAWGYNGYGSLGLGNTTNYSSPKQVGSLNTWYKLSGGTTFVLSIKTDGTLWSWGRNDSGQLGLGNITNYSSPMQVGALTTWSNVFSSSGSSYAIKTDGTLWSWGNGLVGALGLGNTTYYSSPMQVGALTNWAKVTTNGANFALAVKTNGTLWGWGYNVNGQLGLNNTTNYSSPKQVGSLTTWAKTFGGSSYSMAIDTSGKLYAWGNNNVGQLGLSNTTNYSSPKQVGALTTWSSVSLGANQNLGLA